MANNLTDSTPIVAFAHTLHNGAAVCITAEDDLYIGLMKAVDETVHVLDSETCLDSDSVTAFFHRCIEKALTRFAIDSIETP